MKNIGKTVRLLRQSAGLRQGELADRLGVSQNYLSLIENSKRSPSLQFLSDIATQLEIPPAALLWTDLDPNTFDDEEMRRTANDINDLFWRVIRNRLALGAPGKSDD